MLTRAMMCCLFVVVLAVLAMTTTTVAFQSNVILPRNTEQQRLSPLLDSSIKPSFDSKSSSSDYQRQQRSSSYNNQHNKQQPQQGKPYRRRTRRQKFHDELKRQRNHGAKYAEEVLIRQLENQKEDINNNRTSLVTEFSFNIVLMGYAKEAGATSAVSAEALLQQMISHDITPSAFTYNTVIQAWSNQAKKKRNLQQNVKNRPYYAILRLYEDMQKRYQLQPTTFTYTLIMGSNLPLAPQWYQTMLEQNLLPDRQIYHVLFESYSQNATNGAAEEADAILEELMQFEETTIEKSNDFSRNNDNNHYNLRPHTIWINCVISAWSKSSSPARGKKADSWFQRMQSLGDCHPNTSTYSQLMNVHASLYLEEQKSSHKKRVVDLLQDLEYRHSTFSVGNQQNHLQPDVITYTTAMKVMTAPQALELLQKMKEGPRKMQPNIITYNTLIEILCRSPEKYLLPQNLHPIVMASKLYNELLQDPRIQLNAVTYTKLIFGWSRTRRADAGYRAQELLQELEMNIPPSTLKNVDLTKLYNAVMLAWGRTSNPNAPHRVEELLDRMESTKVCTPNIVTYISLADAYAKASIPNAEVKCEALLQRMQQNYPNNIKPNRVLYNSILNALAKSCQPSAISKAEEIFTIMGDDVDIVTYSTMVDCYTKCCNDPAVASKKAEDVLKTVEDVYESTQDKHFKPSPVFYSAILQAYAKSNVGDIQAESLLRRNEKLFHSNSTRYEYCKPHAILYNAVMDAIARSGNPDAGRRAEAILQEMEEQLDDGGVSRRSLNAVLLAYRHDADACDKAEYILERMEELTFAGVYDVMPDVIAWNTAIAALAGHNAERAHSLFQRMQGRLDVKPDGTTYSHVIQAWLKRNDEYGMQMAQELLNDYYNNHHSNNHRKDNDLTSDPVFHVVQAYQQQKKQRSQHQDDEDNEAAIGTTTTTRSSTNNNKRP